MPPGPFPPEISSGERHITFEPPTTYEPTKPVISDGQNIVDEKENIIRGPLMSRAWVLQEIVLSPRTIYYGSEPLFWECTIAAGVEINAKMASRRDKHSLHAIKAIFEDLGNASSCNDRDVLSSLHFTWTQLLRSYTAGTLTYQTDKWLAIAGLASRLGLAAKMTIMAG